MRISVERLRVWLLAGAGLLVVVVAGFLGVARFRAHRFLAELPAKLGADVRQETNAFTYSQSVKGRTVFTLHAAKAIQHKDGKYTLHDVGIAVYGHGQGAQGQAQGPAQGGAGAGERVDRIYGKEFELDQAAGVVKAVGEVHLDLEAPAATDAKGKMDDVAGMAKGGHERGDERLIHVKTWGLVYLRKLGVAATDQPLEFEYHGMTGEAKGAEYDADTGVLTLQSAVKMSGLERGKPVVLTASRAELDRVMRRALLTDARYVSVGGADDKGGSRQVVEARRGMVTMRAAGPGSASGREASGNIDRLDGEGGVTVASGDGLKAMGDRGEVVFGDEGRPRAARLMGHVTYALEDAAAKGKGNSAEARVGFDAAGRAQKVLLGGGVHLNERVEGAANAGWSERELSAGAMEIVLAADAAGKARPRDVVATGGARLKVVDGGGVIKGQRSSAMAAEVLTARFMAGGGRDAGRLDEVRGDGRAALERVSETGVAETSEGDALVVRFRGGSSAGHGEAKAAASPVGGLAGGEVESALLNGHVVVTRKTPPAKGEAGAAAVDRATAERAEYAGAAGKKGAGVMTLTGHVAMTSEDGMLWADRVMLEQGSGDAVAEGSVKASYGSGAQARQGAASGVGAQAGFGQGAAVAHVLADRAELTRASGVAVFHGGAGRAARLWQEGSQVEAPVLEFNQKQRRLVARGDGSGAAMAVRTVLVSAGAKDAASGASPNAGSSAVDSGMAKTPAVLRRSAVVRVASREMVYSEEQRTAEFTGGVRVESSDGVMKGDRATAYLEGAGASASSSIGKLKKKTDTGFLAGGVERVVVAGGITIDQPGRHATGERLVYTAGDGLLVLTGTDAAPPRVVDQARGAVTGAELRFRAEDESVVISNGDKSGAGLRVHTETRVKRER